MSKKPLSTKLIILGQKNIGKTALIKDYINSSKSIHHKKEKEGKISFFKELESSQQFKITINKYSEKSEKIINTINESQCVFILFDMANRKSFEKLLDDWLIFLRDSCHYKGLVFIFGKHCDKNEPLMTDEEEIKEMIKVSEVDCSFYNIGNNEIEQNNEIIEQLISHAVENAKTNNANKKDCIIF